MQLIRLNLTLQLSIISATQVAKIVKKFKISEKHLWRIKIQTFCRLGLFQFLSKLSSEKKSPIGYKPFAVACIKYVHSVCVRVFV